MFINFIINGTSFHGMVGCFSGNVMDIFSRMVSVLLRSDLLEL